VVFLGPPELWTEAETELAALLAYVLNRGPLIVAAPTTE
jgi:hypothetical protein